MSARISELNVVEISSVLAGPSVGMFFAERGAKVVKIENKRTGGDITRSWKLPSEDPDSNVSAYFCSVNWNKKHVFLDFRDEKDQQKLRQYLLEAHIVITNFKKGDDVKFGLDYPSVKALQPEIIYGSITGFGAESDRVAYDLILQAEAGYMSMNGTEDSPPVKMPVAFIDLFAGHQLRTGLLEALLEQSVSGGAFLVEVSLYDSALASLANQATNWLMAGHIPKRIGSKHPNIAPYGEIFTTTDNEEVTFAIGSDKHFRLLCEILGVDYLAEDSKFQNNSNRVKNRTELEKLLQRPVASFKTNELIEKLSDKKVPVARIRDLSRVFQDKQAQNLILKENVSGIKTQRIRSSVYRLSR